MQVPFNVLLQQQQFSKADGILVLPGAFEVPDHGSNRDVLLDVAVVDHFPNGCRRELLIKLLPTLDESGGDAFAATSTDRPHEFCNGLQNQKTRRLPDSRGLQLLNSRSI